MEERNATDFLNFRLPLYAYTAPLWLGRRVLEIGCEEGDSPTYLAAHGAAHVVVIDSDVARIERARKRFAHARVDYRPAADLRQMGGPEEMFDLVVVPDGKSLIGNRNLLAVLKRILSPTGHIMISVPAADRHTPAFADGLGYYELVDALEGQFRVVRMLGRTPFLGFGLVEFDSASDALRVDATLLQGGTEAPSHYVAIAGATAPPTLGYALIQVPFAPIEAILTRGASAESSAEPAESGQRLREVEAERAQQSAEIAQLKRQLEEARRPNQVATRPAGSAVGGSPPVVSPDSGPEEAAATTARAVLAERRLDEVERRGRARLDEAEGRLFELRQKLDEALGQSESAVRVSRVQGGEIDELRGRLKRAGEDRAAIDDEMAKLRRALAEADEAVLTLTRRTAQEMTAVAEHIAEHISGGLRTAGNGDVDLLREREGRIAALEADKRVLIERVRALEESAAPRRDAGLSPLLEGEEREEGEQEREEREEGEDQDVSSGAGRGLALRELHRIAAAQVTEVGLLRAAIDEQAALVVELEDALGGAEARAATAEKDSLTLRRNAKTLEDADRARRGRLAELEGKLLRLEHAKGSVAAGGPRPAEGASDGPGLAEKLASMEQRALVAEQRLVGLEEQLLAVQRRATAAETREGTTTVPAVTGTVTAGTPAHERIGMPFIEDESTAVTASAKNGAHAGGSGSGELAAAIEEVEEQLRHELRMLAAIEETLSRARDEISHTHDESGDKSEHARALAAKDAQLIEGRLEMTRLRREAEARQVHLEREVTDLRDKLNPFGQHREDPSLSTQLIVMHTTLANIRRRAARLRDELEGFRRRLDSLPAGALSSLLEEIGEDLGEFAK